MARYLGGDLYMELAKESTFGTAPDWSTVSPLYKVYGRGDTFYDVRSKPDQVIMETNVGHGRPFHNIQGIERVQGTFRTWAFPTQAEDFIAWGATLTSNELDSYAVRIDGGQETLVHTGLKVQRMTISSGADIGAQRLTLEYDLIGQGETTDTTFTEDTYDTDDAYRHADGTLTLNGSTDATVQDFQLTFQNTLDVGNGTGTQVQWIDFGGRQVQCQLTVAYQDATLKNEFQAGTLTDVTMAYSHTKGALYDLTLNLQTRVAQTDFQELEPLAGVSRAQMSFVALLDSDPSGTDFAVSVD